MEMTASESYRMWNFLEWIRKGMGDQQKSHIVYGSPFLALVFSRGVAHFYGVTLAMNFDCPRVSKTNLETSLEYLQRHFLNRPARFFSGTNQWQTDRPSFLGTEIPCPQHCPRTSCIFCESISIDVSKKVYVILCNLWIYSKIGGIQKVRSLRSGEEGGVLEKRTKTNMEEGGS